MRPNLPNSEDWPRTKNEKGEDVCKGCGRTADGLWRRSVDAHIMGCPFRSRYYAILHWLRSNGL